uniref:Putative DNA binding, helix-turn-helix domain containing protein n=1 Tax=viral metagenome TaxID=1070528 RepID=A0A6H1ZDU9_9ZZZZ
MLKTVAEICKIYGVTDPCVRIWIKKGLPYKIEKVVGIKPRMVIQIEDVEKFMEFGIKTYEKV